MLTLSPHSGVRVWDVVSELVCLCTIPSPTNPFALDMRYIKRLPLPDRFLVTGALLNFLEMYVVYGNRDELHYDKGAFVSFWCGDQQAVLLNRLICRRCLDSLWLLSPFSGGGGEASEASPCPVPAGGAASQTGLRPVHQQSRSAPRSRPTVTVFRTQNAL